MIQEVALFHRDRLVYFGLKLLKYVFKKNDVKLVVVSNYIKACSETNETIEAIIDLVQELADNLIKIIINLFIIINGTLF